MTREGRYTSKPEIFELTSKKKISMGINQYYTNQCYQGDLIIITVVIFVTLVKERISSLERGLNHKNIFWKT